MDCLLRDLFRSFVTLACPERSRMGVHSCFLVRLSGVIGLPQPVLTTSLLNLLVNRPGQRSPQTQYALPFDISPRNQAQAYGNRDCAHRAEENLTAAHIPSHPQKQYPRKNEQAASEQDKGPAQIAALLDTRFHIGRNVCQSIMRVPELVIFENPLFQPAQRFTRITFGMHVPGKLKSLSAMIHAATFHNEHELLYRCTVH